MSVTGQVILIAGASSASGVRAAETLMSAGARVIAVGSHRGRLDAAFDRLPQVKTFVCALESSQSVHELAESIRTTWGPIDGLIHLVGGWRGGGGMLEQTDEDWHVLDAGFTTLRNTTRAFYKDLVASPAGRLAIVSSTAVDAPTAANANYAAAKAAAEAWVVATADGFHRDQAANRTTPVPQRAAAVRFVVKALVDPEMRTASPEKNFIGFTDVDVLARAFADLWSTDAAGLNGARLRLAPEPKTS